MIIPRKLYKKTEKYLKTRQALVITGMRRVGKTTLLRYLYERIENKNKLFLDLEDPLNREIFEKLNYELVKTALARRGINFYQKTYLFLDEIQFTPHLPSIVKYLYDHYQIKFFLTGSASFYLKNLFSESLAGRKFIFELFPLDFEEFLWFKKVNYRLPDFGEEIDKNTHKLFSPFLEEYLSWGGMPEVVLTEAPEEKNLLLHDIFSSYFQKEVQGLGDFRKNNIVRDLILLLGKRTGQKVDIQRLSQELGVGRPTVYEYLDFLAGTYFISLVSAYGGEDIMVRKQKKVYFIDGGLLSVFQNSQSGAIFENGVFQNLKNFTQVFYYQKGSQEIDFIVKRDKETLVFEVKETATLSDEEKLKKLSQRLGFKKYFLISKNFSQVKKAKYLFQKIYDKVF